MADRIAGKRVAFVIAPENFRDEEYFQPKVILQSHGFSVDTIVKGDPEEVTGSKGGKARTDAHFDTVTPENYDILIFAGGPGAKVYLQDTEVHDLVWSFYSQSKVVAAICIAPSILANAGILTGKKATAYPDQKENLVTKGAYWLDEPVVVDGHIVTASGPEAAIEFGEKIAHVLATDHQ